MRIITFLLVFALMNASTGYAQPCDSVTIKEIKSTVEAIKKKFDEQAATAKEAQKNEPGKKDTMPGNGDTLLFRAWQYAKKHPGYLYCDTCKMGVIDCKTVRKGIHYFTVTKIVSWIVLVLILFFALKLFRRDALCRDESYMPGVVPLQLRPVNERPYSFAKTQLFWWTLIVFTCYAIFFALYGTLLPLNPTSILLLGGGIATQLLGKTIDQTQIDNTVRDTPDGARPVATRHQDVEGTKGLLKDILSDENGVSIHRLQSLMFNLIYGIAYIAFFFKSITGCDYPLIDFEEWQLVLLGISHAGYLGMKTTENSKKTENARVAQTEKSSGKIVAPE